MATKQINYFMLKRNEEGDQVPVLAQGTKVIIDHRQGCLMTALRHDPDSHLWTVTELYTGLLLVSDSTRNKVTVRLSEMADRFFNLMLRLDHRSRTLEIYEKNHKIVLDAYEKEFPEAFNLLPDPESAAAYVRSESFLAAIKYKEDVNGSKT